MLIKDLRSDDVERVAMGAGYIGWCWGGSIEGGGEGGRVQSVVGLGEQRVVVEQGGVISKEKKGKVLREAFLLGSALKQSQVNYNELELQLKSLSSNLIG